jgi:hypothetical protein
MANELIYLATPYTDPDPEVREKRFQVVNKIAATLMANGNHIFSPISHCHPIALAGDLPKEWEYWEKYCRLILRFCTKLMVVCQEGWQKSVGVQNEMKIAEEMRIPIEYIEVQ